MGLGPEAVVTFEQKGVTWPALGRDRQVPGECRVDPVLESDVAHGEREVRNNHFVGPSYGGWSGYRGDERDRRRASNGFDGSGASQATLGNGRYGSSSNEIAASEPNWPRISLSSSSSTFSVGTNGYRIVMWAGTPRCADQSYWARHSETERLRFRDDE